MKILKSLAVLMLFIFCVKGSGQNSKLNQSLIKTIDSMFQKDDGSLRKASELRALYGMQSARAKEQDSITHVIRINNLIEIDKILAQYGWPGEDVIGEDGGHSLFAIIQHANMNTRPKYVPIMRKAVTNGVCRPRYLAGVEDRIATDQGKLQIYGDQVKFYPKTETFDVWPIIDPENVDQRRASIGLGPIAIHLKNRFNLDWDLEDQKIRTTAFLEEMKKKE
jgi:hypothetical protein